MFFEVTWDIVETGRKRQVKLGGYTYRTKHCCRLIYLEWFISCSKLNSFTCVYYNVFGFVFLVCYAVITIIIVLS